VVDPLSFVVAGSLLFVFWAYGVVSFVLDVKNRLVPAIRRYRAGEDDPTDGGPDPDERTEDDHDEEAAREKLRQLY
jgi:hypothetical protein